MSDIKTDTTSKNEIPSLLIKGFFMGSADVVPGVSGGTIALILGIYTRLIDAIKSFDVNFIRNFFRFRIAEAFSGFHWKFLMGVLSGIFAAILFFTRIVRLPELMHSHPEAVYGLFFGLILGSIWFVSRDAGKFDLKSAGWVLLGTAIGFRIVTLVPADTPEHSLFIFFSGAIAITAMILPGISGSFILLILRKYDYILSQFGKLGSAETLDAFIILIPFGLGLICGIVLFSRILSWLLHRFRKATYCVLIGFMTGSLWVIWPWQDRLYETIRDKDRLISSNPVLPDVDSTEFTWGILMLLAGLILVVALELFAKHKKES